MKYTFILVLFLFQIYGSVLKAADWTTFRYRLEVLSMNQGLSQHDVSFIAQDHYGFIWIATYDGLLRYDGYTFKTFRYNAEDPSSISDNRVLAIHSDSADHLWIATEGGGLNLYNYELETFTHFELGNDLLDNNVYCIYESVDGDLWASTHNRVYRLEYSEENTQLKASSVLSGLDDKFRVLSLYVHIDDELFLGTYDGMYSLCKKGNSYGMLRQVLSTSSLSISVIKNLNAGRLLLGGGKGICIYDCNTQKTVQLHFPGIDLKKVRAIEQLDANSFLIGTQDMGVFSLIFDKERYDLIPLETDKPLYWKTAMVKTLFIDNMRNVWVGTSNNGVGRMNLLAPKFYRILDSEEEAGCFIRSFYKDKAGNLWLQPKQGRLTCKRKEGGTVEYTDFPYLVNNLVEDEEGNIWVSTSANIYLFERTLNYQHPQAVITPSTFSQHRLISIRGVQIDSVGNVWAGYKDGLIRIKHLASSQFECKVYDHFNLNNKSLNFIQLCFDQKKKFLWAATRNFGLFMFELDTLGDIVRHTHFYSSDNIQEQINSNHVWAVTQSHSGKIWVGTDAGLNSIEFANGKIKIENFNKYDVLKNIKILSIIEDQKGYLWMSTSNGLVCYNPETHQANHFHYSDGLSSNSLVEASQMDTTGMIYFASINGITYFNPDEIKLNPLKPEIRITSFQVFNKEVVVGEKMHGRVLLSKSIIETQELSLKHNENNFTIGYVGIHFNHPASNVFAHQLVGYDKDWICRDAEHRFASYNNLPPGKYQLRIKAANSDKVWTDDYCTINLEIKPAPWATWWAYLIYVLLIVTVLYIILLYYKWQESLKHKLEIEQLGRAHDKELNDNRLKFHTNITHEIKTPLTLIAAPLEELLASPMESEFVTSRLSLIRRNVDRLSGLVSQFLDLRKIDKSSLPLCVREVDICSCLEDIVDTFKPFASQKKIDLSLFFEEKIIVGWIDEEKLGKILTNLLSNAVKYTPSGKSISVCVGRDGNYLKLVVEDTGCGMDEEDLPHIFERFYQCNNQLLGGTGIGLSLVHELVQVHHGTISVGSEKNVGSIFEVSIPIVLEFYKNDELRVDNLPDQKVAMQLYPYELSGQMEDMGEYSQYIILVVEDELDMREYLCQCLSPHFKVLKEDNARSGYQAALKYVPDLILTDLMMPDVDGLEFCNMIKNDFRTSHIPVVMLTAKSGEEDLMKGFRAGAEIYLTKPFNPERLILQLRNMIVFRTFPEKQGLGENEQFSFTELNERERKFIDKLNNWLELHLEQIDYNVEDICREIGISRMQLHRKLTAIVGQSTSEFIRNYKMKRAKIFLESGNFNVSEVADRVGFKTISHFSKIFKSVYGYPPSDLLK